MISNDYNLAYLNSITISNSSYWRAIEISNINDLFIQNFACTENNKILNDLIQIYEYGSGSCLFLTEPLNLNISMSSIINCNSDISATGLILNFPDPSARSYYLVLYILL